MKFIFPQYYLGASLIAQMVKNPPTMLDMWVWNLGWEETLEEEMATHPSILTWEILWIEEPGGLQSPWDHKRVRCNLATKQQQQQCIYLFSSLLGFHCCAQAFSSCSEPGLFSGSNAQTSMPWLLLFGLMDGFSNSDTGLSYPVACEIFQTRDRTHVPWIGRQIPNHQGSPIVSVLFLSSHILY